MSPHLSKNTTTAGQQQLQQNHHLYTSKPYQHIHHQQKQFISSRKQRSIGNYLLGKTIGRGASGRVKIGIHCYTGEKVAIKMIPRSRLATSSVMARCVQRELAILQLVHHPHIVHLEEVLQDRQTVYFVMEYVQGGELFDILSTKGRMTEADARNLFSQLTTALAWCHEHHICHRDLKPENILLDKDKKHLKIADFGIATIQPPGELLQTSCGSPHYASPEIVKGIPYYGPATDVWSCGVILYAMLTGYLPFDDPHVSRLMSKIKTGRYNRLPDDISPEARDLVQSMLVVDPSKRIALDAVLAHPWLTDKFFLGADLRFPDALAFSHYYRQYYQHYNVPNPLHDRVLTGPLSTDALDGRTWETLKVLWRHYTQEELTAALTSVGPNVPKLTCRLLIQRAWREEQGVTSATASYSSEDDDDSMPATPPPGTLPFSYASRRRQSSTSDAAASTSCGDWPPPPPPPSALSIPNRTHHLPVTTSRSQQVHIQKRRNRPLDSMDQLTSTRIYHRHSPCTVTPQKVADTMLIQHLLVQPTIASSERPRQNASQRLWAIGHTAEPKKGWVDTFLGWWRTRPAMPVDQAKGKAGTSTSIQRQAKHEYEAAGKMHQILEEHFDGKLCGRMYPTGQIVWSGSIASPTNNVNDHTLRGPSKLEFHCSICPSSDSDDKTVTITFSPVKGDSSPLQPVVNQLMGAWDQYDNEAGEVTRANGWSSYQK